MRIYRQMIDEDRWMNKDTFCENRLQLTFGCFTTSFLYDITCDDDDNNNNGDDDDGGDDDDDDDGEHDDDGGDDDDDNDDCR